ncbi:terpene synthase [Pseudomonas sp. B6002]|uniref:terpene synthase family protein n=1 Tax=Pseudomonas sp. B6002 TaxID=2726978 RepID=UPI00210DA6C9|nr:terpene synthase [Pseudomonas sp. B6002]
MIEQPCLEWLAQWKLFPDTAQRDRLAVAGIGPLCGMIYPQGPLARLQVATDYMIWTFAYDDEICDEGPASGDPNALISATSRIQRMLESPEVAVDATDRYGLALRDIRRRMMALGSAREAARLTAVLRTYFMAEMWKAVAPRPTLSDYVTQRLMGGGGVTFPMFCYWVPNVSLSEKTLVDRRVMALTEIAAFFAVLDNDLFSFPKDSMRGQDKKGHNLVDAVSREYDCSPSDAIVTVVRMRERILGLYLRLQRSLRGQASVGLRRYLSGLDCYISGELQWHRMSPRYRYINAVDGACCLVGADVAEEPQDDSTEPLPIASIAWWWHYDPAGKTT